MSFMFGFATGSDELAYLDDSYGILTSIDMKRKAVSKRIVMPFESYRAYSSAVKYADTFVLAPWTGDEINVLFYNNHIDQVDFVRLKENPLDSEHGFFNDVLLVGERVFLIPFQYGALVEINVHTREVEYHFECVNEVFPKSYDLNKGFLFRFAALWREDTIVMPCFELNRIVLYRIFTRETEYFDLQVEGHGFCGAVVDGDSLYLLSRDKGFICLCNLITREITNRIALDERDGDLFMNLVDCGDYVLALQRSSDVSYKIYKRNMKVHSIELNTVNSPERINILCAKRTSSEEVWMTARDEEAGLFGVYDISTGLVQWVPIPGTRNQQVFKNMFYNNVMVEGEETRFESFLWELLI